MESLSPQFEMHEPSALLRLPAELRNTIYELVADPSGDGKNLIFAYNTAGHLSLDTNLTAVCRQLRAEYYPHLPRASRAGRAD